MSAQSNVSSLDPVSVYDVAEERCKTRAYQTSVNLCAYVYVLKPITKKNEILKKIKTIKKQKKKIANCMDVSHVCGGKIHTHTTYAYV